MGITPQLPLSESKKNALLVMQERLRSKQAESKTRTNTSTQTEEGQEEEQSDLLSRFLSPLINDPVLPESSSADVPQAPAGWQWTDSYYAWRKNQDAFSLLYSIRPKWYTETDEPAVPALDPALGMLLAKPYTPPNQPSVQAGKSSGLDRWLGAGPEKQQAPTRETEINGSVGDPNSPHYDPEFDQYSGYVSTKHDGITWGSVFQNPYFLGYEDLTYEYINGDEDQRSKILAATKIGASFGGMYSALGNRISDDQYHSYDMMTQSQIETYNYYYSKHGKAAAERYLKSIQNGLNTQLAEKRFADMEGNVVKELGFGFVAGLDRHAQGINNLLQPDPEAKTSSATQMLSGMVRQDMEGAEIPLWYNWKTGEFETKIAGNSVGQIGYDVINNLGNAFPAWVTRAVLNFVNPVAGAMGDSLLSGASAAGNGQQDMINQGYPEDQARVYGVMVGASEALLNSVFDLAGKGISKITGKTLNNLGAVDGVLRSVAASIPGKYLMGGISEGVQEGIQEILDPIFAGIATGEEMETDWESVLYSSLLGFLMGGPGGLIKSNQEYSGIDPRNADVDQKKQSNDNAGIIADQQATKTRSDTAETFKKDIVRNLERQNIKRKRALEIADALESQENGQELTERQRFILKNQKIDKRIQTAVNEAESKRTKQKKNSDEIEDSKNAASGKKPMRQPQSVRELLQMTKELLGEDHLSNKEKGELNKLHRLERTCQVLIEQLTDVRKKIASIGDGEEGIHELKRKEQDLESKLSHTKEKLQEQAESKWIQGITNKARKALVQMGMDDVAGDYVSDITPRPDNGNEPINVVLKYMDDWTEEQRAMADEKVKALSEAYTVKRVVEKSASSVVRTYRKLFGDAGIPGNFDIDHMIDLQLGGADDIMNMSPLDSSVNRSLGAQIAQIIKNYPPGTVFGSFTIIERS